MYRVDIQKWHTFPPKIQLANIAAEFTRASQATLTERESGEELRAGAYERALALIDASLLDPKWKDKQPLYELRDAAAALYSGAEIAAVSRFIASALLR